MTIEELINQIKSHSNEVEFDDVINTITEYYDYTASYFSNGLSDAPVTNEAGSNEGSCKIFSFAQLHQLNKNETLNCFGKYYRDDVLKHPNNDDHGNIRTFMVDGWAGIQFKNRALKLK